MKDRSLDCIALQLRRLILKTACCGGSAHIAPALSAADVMATLYFGGVLRHDPKNPAWDDRDIFVLSKGHACLALYAALALAGYFDPKELRTFLSRDSMLGGHPNMLSVPGAEASTGALGHGMLFAGGIAMANKMDGRPGQVYAMVGDGECEEGSIWEGVMSAVYRELDNFVIIVDYNKFQAMDTLESILGLRDLAGKFRAMGCSVSDIDGHDCEAVRQALLLREPGKPRAVIANTVKGKGISFMEGKPLWHCRMPNEAELEVALRDLGMAREELEQL